MRQTSVLAAAMWLLVLGAGCGPGAYRLEGRAPAASDAVVLLHARVDTVADSLRAAYRSSLRALLEERRAREDSLQSEGASGQADLALAREQLKAARERYRNAFAGLDRFRSFGGNPIFSSEDLDVACADLIREIGDRFYRGRAFSLEVETRARHFIRDRLMPEEKRVRRAEAQVARLRLENAGTVEATEALEAWYISAVADLVKRTNRQLEEAVAAAELRRSSRNGKGWYRFHRLSPGSYALYAVDSTSVAWLQPVALQGHTRQDLAEANQRELWVAIPEAGD